MAASPEVIFAPGEKPPPRGLEQAYSKAPWADGEKPMNPTRVIRPATPPEATEAYKAPGEAHVLTPGTAIGYDLRPDHGHADWICKNNLPSNQFNGPDCEKDARIISGEADAAGPKDDKEGGAKAFAQLQAIQAEPYKWPTPAYKPPGEAHVEPPGTAIGYERAPVSGSIGWNCDNEFP